MSAAPFASGRACVRMALPVSSAMIRASSSIRASTASAIFCSIRPRSRGMTRLQLAKALLAACTARPTSSAPPRGMLAMIWRFPGDSTDISLPEVLSTQLPSISICARLPVVAAVVLLIATAIAASSYNRVRLRRIDRPLLSREAYWLAQRPKHGLAYCSPSDGSSHRLELIARENSDAQDHPICRCRHCDRDRFRSVGCRAHQCTYYPLARD